MSWYKLLKISVIQQKNVNREDMRNFQPIDIPPFFGNSEKRNTFYNAFEAKPAPKPKPIKPLSRPQYRNQLQYKNPLPKIAPKITPQPFKDFSNQEIKIYRTSRHNDLITVEMNNTSISEESFKHILELKNRPNRVLFYLNDDFIFAVPPKNITANIALLEQMLLTNMKKKGIQ